MWVILFILKRNFITNIILCNNAYDLNIAGVFLRTLKFWLIYTWSLLSDMASELSDMSPFVERYSDGSYRR